MLLDRQGIRSKYPKFVEGMNVFCRDGKKLGRVITTDQNSFIVEKGVFFPKDFSVRYNDIQDIRDDTVYLKQSSTELSEWKEPSYTGWTQVEGINVGKVEAKPTEAFVPHYNAISEEVIRVPLMEEELEAKKTNLKTGEVRIRKIVHTELKHLTVPVMHEEVQIDRVTGIREPSSTENLEAFQESSIEIPLMDEEVSVGKHAKVREEVRLTKKRLSEDRDVTGEIRKEDVEILDEGKRSKKAG